MKNFIVFLGLLLLVSCKEAKKETAPKSMDVIENSTDVEAIIQSILDLPELQQYFHADLPERLPLKLVQNEFVSDTLHLNKFDKKIRIASLASFEKDGVKDYLIIEELSIKNKSVSFSLKYPIEGVVAEGKLVKAAGEWSVRKHLIYETAADNTENSQSANKVLTIVYTGADLSYLSNKYYGHGHFKQVLMAYNDFTDNRSIDKKNDSIKIPELFFLAKDPELPRLLSVAKEINKAVAARDLYLKQGRTIWDLPFSDEKRHFKSIPQTQKLELLSTAKLMFECVAGLEQYENPPKKAIGQFRQVAEMLENIAKGEIDENGYILDMVHQRMAYGFGNMIRWARE